MKSRNERRLRPKDWNAFAEPDAPQMHYVFTVCDETAAEACPVWPGQPMVAHWPIDDPVAVQGAACVGLAWRLSAPRL